MIITATKTDNTNLAAKLALRRHFLDRYHSSGPIRVMDCCSGDGIIWRQLRQEYKLDSYWAVDVKPRKGRLQLHSERILAQPGWQENVIDVDSYGEPWKHWRAMLPNISQPTTVFLTVGWTNVSPLSLSTLKQMGITMRIPKGLSMKIRKHCLPYRLHKFRNFGLDVSEAREMVKKRESHAKYVGIHLRPVSAKLQPATA